MAQKKKTSRRTGKKMSKNSTLIGLVILLFVCLFYYLEEKGYINIGLADSGQKVVINTTIPENRDNMEIWYLDVGQGGSNLLRIPTGSDEYFNMLIDSGEREYGDGLVSYLKGLNIERLDTVVVTHPHSDHMGGMSKVLENFEIGEMYMPETAKKDTPTSDVYDKMLDVISEKKISLNRLNINTKFNLPSTVSADVFSPQEGESFDNINNYSGVFRINFKNTSFMFAGDAETLVEKEILKQNYDLRANVLCLGHHGSDTSTSEKFLEAISPEAGIISCGKNNKYKHPGQKILDRLEENDVTIYRTDEMATIVARSDGNNISFETGIVSVKSSEE